MIDEKGLTSIKEMILDMMGESKSHYHINGPFTSWQYWKFEGPPESSRPVKGIGGGIANLAYVREDPIHRRSGKEKKPLISFFYGAQLYLDIPIKTPNWDLTKCILSELKAPYKEMVAGMQYASGQGKGVLVIFSGADIVTHVTKDPEERIVKDTLKTLEKRLNGLPFNDGVRDIAQIYLANSLRRK